MNYGYMTRIADTLLDLISAYDGTSVISCAKKSESEFRESLYSVLLGTVRTSRLTCIEQSGGLTTMADDPENPRGDAQREPEPKQPRPGVPDIVDIPESIIRKLQP